MSVAESASGTEVVVPVAAPVVAPTAAPVVVPVAVPVVVAGAVVGSVPVPVPVVLPRGSIFDSCFASAVFSHFLRSLLDLSFLHFLSALGSFCASCRLPGLAPAG